MLMMMQQLAGKLFVCFLVALSCFLLPGLAQPPQLPQEEVDALQQVATTMGAKYWSFNAGADACRIDMVGVTENQPRGSQKNTDCECNFENNTVCHVVKLMIKGYSLPGLLPPQLVKLPYLREIDFAYNYLKGTIPREWASMKLTYISVPANRLSGEVPKELGNMTTLTFLNLEANQFSGILPTELGHLVGLQALRISDTNAPSQGFPVLRNMTGLVTLILRNCNISGEIPAYIWSMKNLEMLDVSFNNLVGELPSTIGAERLKFVFLTGNLLSGNVPKSILLEGSNVDLSYNNFKLQGPKQPECQENLNLNLNLYRSFSKEDNLRGILPCLKNFKCPRYSNCMHINCGGSDIIVKDENRRNVMFEGDGGVEGGTAKYFRNEKSMWGFSSTGDFMHGFDQQNTRYSISLESSNLSELYTTARTSPLSLTYFHYCLENGIYTITLHFAEIIFTNDEKYSSLGRRIFDIYVQERLVWKDFNIEDEAGMAQKKLVKQVSNVNVTSNILEIRFYWAGKGTTVIPEKGNYGPLISAISVVSDFKPCKNGGTVRTIYIIAGVGVGGLCLTLFMLAILWWKGCLGGKRGRQQGAYYIKPAMSLPRKYGQLPDGSLIAVKQLSSHSKQGIREFLNEMGIITCLQHPNLVKLHGCCIAEDQLLLVYEYMENNSLAHVLFGSGKKNSHVPNSTCLSLLDWAYQLQRTGKLKELIDENLGTEVNDKEAEVVVKVGVLCTNASASLRPTMSEVVSMLEGQTEVPDIIPEASTYTEDLRFKSLRDVHHRSQTQSLSGSQSQNSANANTFCSSSSSHQAMT
ncbi:hypothetical protein C1H46_042744 [Malus baccata]|uniref:non-specific serine/threonine protein kinase n=1 Tax=Malus baccata TaxID=106549 RepID=A0A540KBW1_MALBA|nr:hypothetical protein C1H46_042744 [Malus baccata]